MNRPALSVRVWDLPTRLFHWSLVLLVLLLWLTGEFGGFSLTLSPPILGDIYLTNMDIHGLAGQGVLILVAFRILWGLWGSTTARFRHFIRGPGPVLADLKALVKGRVTESIGHNPVGGLMVVALLVLLLAQSVTGLFSADDFFFEGPLADRVDESTSETLTGLHHRLFSVLQVLIVAHIAAVLYYLVRGLNLVGPMITGRKILSRSEKLYFAPGWSALLSLVFAVGGILLLVGDLI